MKEVMITEDEFGDNVVLSSLTDFIKENSDGMHFDDTNMLLKLKVNESCDISTHCGFVTVTRIK